MPVDQIATAVARVETALGCPLPSDFRDFVLSPEHADSVETVSFLAQVDSGVWDEDFPFEARPHRFDVDSAITKIIESDDMDEGFAQLNAFMDESFDKPARRGAVVLGEDCCTDDRYLLVLRGPSRGQVWFSAINYNEVLVTPVHHPVTGSPLGFSQWHELWLNPYRLTAQKPKRLNEAGIAHVRLLGPETQTALQYHAAHGQLRGLTESAISRIRKKTDVPESAEFLDPYTNQWKPVRKAVVAVWLGGQIPQ